MSKKKERTLLIIYLLLFFSTALVIALMQPHTDTPPFYGNPPDEPNRFKVASFICKYGTLPNGYDPEIRISGYGISYGFYTMLPYIVQGFFMRFVNLFTDSPLALLYTGRFVNVVCGTIMAAVVYFLAKRLFQDERFKWLFCVLVMFLPQSLFLHTYVNTDSMSMMSTAIILYAWVCAYQEGFTIRNSVILSVGISICALSYYNAYGWILCSIFLFAGYYFYKEKESGKCRVRWKEMFTRGGFIAALVLLMIGWYFIRNAILYDGDFIGMASMKKCALLHGDPAVQPYGKSYQVRGIPVWQMIQERGFFEGLFNSFVAVFGSMAVTGNIWLYRFYKVLFVVGPLSYILIRRPKKMCKESSAGGRQIFFHVNMVLCMIIPLVLAIYYAYSMDYQHQGRYVMPGLLPLMFYVTAGLEKLAGLSWLPKKWEKARGVLEKMAKAVSVLTIVVVVLLMLQMIYAYAVPTYLKIYEIYPVIL